MASSSHQSRRPFKVLTYEKLPYIHKTMHLLTCPSRAGQPRKNAPYHAQKLHCFVVEQRIIAEFRYITSFANPSANYYYLVESTLNPPPPEVTAVLSQSAAYIAGSVSKTALAMWITYYIAAVFTPCILPSGRQNPALFASSPGSGSGTHTHTHTPFHPMYVTSRFTPTRYVIRASDFSTLPRLDTILTS